MLKTTAYIQVNVFISENETNILRKKFMKG